MTTKQKKNLLFGKSRQSNAPLSVRQLTSYLRNLASLAQDPVTGNAALSSALFMLADQVARGGYGKQTSQIAKTKVNPPQDSSDALKLSQLSREDVLKFIEDESRSRLELTELARARFSIPTGNLQKLKTSDLRNKLRAAALHEQSINILSRDAARDGSRRSS